MEFREHKMMHRTEFTVHDGKRLVAKSKTLGVMPGHWLLSLEGACWIDARSRKELDTPERKRLGMDSSKFPHLKVVKGKAAVRKEMVALANQGRG